MGNSFRLTLLVCIIITFGYPYSLSLSLRVGLDSALANNDFDKLLRYSFLDEPEMQGKYRMKSEVPL